jgi:HK97 family phage major capsid protein
MTLRQERLEERRREFLPELAKARQLADTAEAEHRDMTDAERAVFDPIIATGKKLSADFAQLRHDDSVRQFAKDLGNEVGDPLGTGAARTKGQRLHFASMGAHAADKIAAASPNGVKALAASGTVVVEQSFVPDPIALGKPATSLLDVLPVETVGPQFAYLRQSVRTNAAAIVPEGSVKPTSTYTLVRIEDKLDVVAHLNEAIPRFWIIDNASLEAFLRSELEFGLQVAVEAMIIADVAGTSGIQAQPYSTSVLQTVRKSLT